MADPGNRRRLLDKLLRELVRCESQATEHALREERRLGEAPPALALREAGAHAAAMRTRFCKVLDDHELQAGRPGISATLTSLRHLLTDRVHDPERSFRGALLDLRHGVDVVRVLREVARLEELFALIRWCDDWLGVRRTLVARASAQLGWFTEQAHAVAASHEREQAEHSRDLDTSPASVDRA